MLSSLLSAAGAIMSFKDSYDNSQAGTWDEKLVDATNKLVTNKKFPLMKNDGNMIRFLGGFIVEPVIIVTKDVNREDIVQRVMELNTDIFCSFYMQTFEVLRTMYKVDPMSAVTILGTDGDTVLGKTIKSAGGYALSDYSRIKHSLGTESFIKTDKGTFKFGLESLGFDNGLVLSNENDDRVDPAFINGMVSAYNDNLTGSEQLEVNKLLGLDTKKPIEEQIGNLDEKKQKDLIKFIGAKFPQSRKDLEKLASGASTGEPVIGRREHDKDSLLPTILFRNFEVNVAVPVDDPLVENRVSSYVNFKLPITVKAHVIVCDADDIVNMIAPNGDDKSFFSRWEDYRSGAIGFTDLLFAGDLIRQYKDNKLKDKNKLIELFNNRANSAAAKTVNYNASERKIESETTGFEKYYNMLIFTSDDRIVLEKALGGKLNDRKYINKLLELTGSLLYSQVDLNHERIDMEMSGKIGHSSVDFKTLQKRRSGGTQDFSEILKALVMNRPPVF